MRFTRTHLIIYSLMGVVALLVGALISQMSAYQAKLLSWKMAARKCTVIAEKQDQLIKHFLR